MIKHVIWDLDGTLFETFPAITNSILASLADQGFHPKPELVRELAKISVSHCPAILAETYRISASEIIEGFNHHYGKIPYFEQPIKPGALDVCSDIYHSLENKHEDQTLSCQCVYCRKWKYKNRPRPGV